MGVTMSVIYWRAKGKTAKEIAFKTGRTQSNVYKELSKLELPPHKTNHMDFAKERHINRCLSGMISTSD